MASGLATGASWWLVKRIPRRTTEAQGEMNSARRGPSTESLWKSPQ